MPKKDKMKVELISLNFNRLTVKIERTDNEEKRDRLIADKLKSKEGREFLHRCKGKFEVSKW
jgi:hypothetical protein